MTCGEGHNAIARSIRDGFGDGHEVKIVDAYENNRPGYDNKLYLNTVRYIPRLYDKFWHICRRFRANRRYRGFAMHGIKRGADAMARAVEEYRPDLVICTHNQVSNIFCWLKIHNRVRVPVYTIFFDYINCPLWEGSVLCDAVFTPNPVVHPALLERGFCEEQLICTGFPVHPKFGRAVSKEEARAKMGIASDAFVVLSVNGGAGIGNTKGLVKAVMNADAHGKEVIACIVCGRNEKAKRQIERMKAKRGWDRVRVFGFVENIPELMTASDLYFCRGGGGAVSEAMESGTNFVIREGVTAQERGNKAIFLAKKLCYGMKRVSDARRILEYSISHPEEEAAMHGRVKEFAVKGGVQNIVAYILRTHMPSEKKPCTGNHNMLNGGGRRNRVNAAAHVSGAPAALSQRNFIGIQRSNVCPG